MSTFLQLVQDLARQSGTLAGGTTLASVSGVSGRADKLVNWTKQAWTDIQNQRVDWQWMYDTFSDALLVDTLRYTGSSFNLTRLRKWAIDTPVWQPITLYDSTLGQSDESAINYIPFNLWRSRYDRGTHDHTRPVEYSISPTNELCIGPKPDAAYVIRGEYWKTPQTLSANSDEPEMPERFHQLIVYRAMMLMAGGDESAPTFQFAKPEYDRLFNQLCIEQLPAPSANCGALV